MNTRSVRDIPRHFFRRAGRGCQRICSECVFIVRMRILNRIRIIFIKEVRNLLLQDEQYVVKWLTQYGSLTKNQVIKLLYNKPPKTAEKIIANLKRQLMISDVSGGYYLGMDPLVKPDQRIISAVWVLLRFIEQVEPMAHYPASYPSQIFFLKQDIGYEIVVLYEGEQHLTRLLQPDEDLKYILVLPHISMAKELRLPKAPCLFATVDYAGGDEPGVTFYTGGESNGSEKNAAGL